MQDSAPGAVRTRQGPSSVAIRVLISLFLFLSLFVCLCSFVAFVKVNEHLVSGAGGRSSSSEDQWGFFTWSKSPLESFMGLGLLFAGWNMVLFKQSCVLGRVMSQLCRYPTILVCNLPWAQRCCRASAAGKGMWGARQLPHN